MTKRLTTQLVVRIDERLRAALEADAEAYGRTMAQSARFILTKTLLAKESV